MPAVESVLADARAAGRRSLVSYVTAGIRADWPELITEMALAGADAIEIGLPFSDPMLDGPVIQQASRAALARGATFDAILAQVRRAGAGQLRGAGGRRVPLIAMSYASPLVRRGLAASCRQLAAAGFSGLIVPDLPLCEAGDYLATACDAGLDATLMVSPATSAAHLREVARRTRGFLYLMSVMNTTGSVSSGADAHRWELAARARAVSPRPALLGFGIDTPGRAAAAARHADGVVVASALMRQVLDGAPVTAIGSAVRRLRAAVDAAGKGPEPGR